MDKLLENTSSEKLDEAVTKRKQVGSTPQVSFLQTPACRDGRSDITFAN